MLKIVLRKSGHLPSLDKLDGVLASLVKSVGKSGLPIHEVEIVYDLDTKGYDLQAVAERGGKFDTKPDS